LLPEVLFLRSLMLKPMAGEKNKAYLPTLPVLIADSIVQAYKALQPAG